MMIPWQERPINNNDVLWRYSNNPIIKRNSIPSSNSIFNSAVVPYKDAFVGVFRCDNKCRKPYLHVGHSNNGIDWNINPNPISFIRESDDIDEFSTGYDPRVCFVEDRYYITWCNAFKGMPTIGVAYTYDFKEFYQTENAFLPYNRNGVMFPKKINGKFAIMSRPSDGEHTPFGDIFYSESPDMIHWGKHKLMMKSGDDFGWWRSTKVGAGPIPIETKEGWLLIYHGVLTSCNGFVYSAGAALLDLEQPWKVLCNASPYILSPQESYECVGDVPNVVFPCAALTDESGKLALYYGAADTVTSLAFGYVDEIIDFVKRNSNV